MKKVLILDLETTGLGFVRDAIWQVSYLICEETDGKLKVKEHSEEVFLSALPTLFMLRRKKGRMKRHEEIVREKIGKLIEDVDLVVAHNVAFERDFLITYRIYSIGLTVKTYCTMKKTINLCKIEHKIYGYKYPKLSEAVSILLNEKVDENKLHDASYDVILTAKLYAYLNNLELDFEGCKVKKASNLLKNIVGLIASPIDPYKGKREKIKRPFLIIFLNMRVIRFFRSVKRFMREAIRKPVNLIQKLKERKKPADNYLYDDDDVPF